MPSTRHQLTVTVSDADRNLDFVLDLKLTAWPEVAASLSPSGYGWSPPESAGMEIEECRCMEIVVWLNGYGVSAYPGHEKPESLELKFGELCLEKYGDEIEEKAWAELNETAEREADRD